MDMKRLSPTTLLLALLCFFLTFFSFSCQDRTLLSLNGIQLVTGTTIEVPQMFGTSQRQKINGEPTAAFALVLIVCGVRILFLKAQVSSGYFRSIVGLERYPTVDS